MTQAARVYGGSLYDLATEEKLDGQIMEQMIASQTDFSRKSRIFEIAGRTGDS